MIERTSQRADEAASIVGLAARVEAAVVDAEVGEEVCEEVDSEEFVLDSRGRREGRLVRLVCLRYHVEMDEQGPWMLVASRGMGEVS